MSYWGGDYNYNNNNSGYNNYNYNRDNNYNRGNNHQQQEQKQEYIKTNKQEVLQAQQLLDVTELTIKCFEKFGELIYKTYNNNNKNKKELKNQLKTYNTKSIGVISSFDVLCEGQSKTKTGKKGLSICASKFIQSLELIQKKYKNNPQVINDLLPFYESILLLIGGKKLIEFPKFKVENFNNKNLSLNIKKLKSMQIKVNERNKEILNNFEKYANFQNKEYNNKKTKNNMKKYSNYKINSKKQNINTLYKYVGNENIDYKFDSRKQQKEFCHSSDDDDDESDSNNNNYDSDGDVKFKL